MPKTSAYIHFPLYDIAIKADATFSCNSVQPFSNPADLADFNICSKLATFESNFWLLGGENKLAPNAYSPGRIGLVTAEVSGGDGSFTTNPALTIVFGSSHTVDGVTLYFSETDWASEATIYYYNASDSVLLSRTIYPTSSKYYDDAATLANVKKIVITFVETNNPYRFIKLENIDFGRSLVFSGNELKRATVVEEIDPTSIQCSTNSLELEVVSSAELLENADSAKNNGWPIDAYELVENDFVYMGRFYLDEWEEVTDLVIRLDCVDKLKILGNVQYIGSAFYYPHEIGSLYTIGGLIDNIAVNAGFDYSIDADISATEFWSSAIYASSARDALQKIALAVGAYVTCSRSDIVQIKKMELADGVVDSIIASSDKGIGSKLKLRPLVTGVDVTSHHFNYQFTTSESVIYQSYLENGTYYIVFESPVYEWANNTGVTTATISISSPPGYNPGAGKYMSFINFAVITITSPGILSLIGKYYIPNKIVHSVSAAMSTGMTDNIIKIGNDEFVSRLLGQTAAQRIYDYYEQRYVQELKLYASLVSVGDKVRVDAKDGQYFYGIVESMKTEMVGGFTSKVKAVGIVSDLIT